MKRFRLSLLFLTGISAVLFGACKADFTGTCVDDLNGMKIAPLLTMSDASASDLSGLTCVSYAVSSNDLNIDLINVWSGCEEDPYEGNVVSSSKTAASIELEDPTKHEDAGCMCPYTFSFTVNNVDTTSDFTLTYQDIGTGEGDARPKNRAVLHLGVGETGMVCKYDYYNMSGEGYGPPCAADRIPTVETVDGTEQSLCLFPCVAPADCAKPFSCSDGLCRLVEMIAEE